MVSVCLECMLDDVLVGVVVKDGSPSESSYFDIVAYSRKRSDVWLSSEDGGDRFTVTLVLHFAFAVVHVEDILHYLGFFGEVMVGQPKPFAGVDFVSDNNFGPGDPKVVGEPYVGAFLGRGCDGSVDFGAI